MLSFLSPLFLFGAATVAVPVVLHLLKREPEARVRFPTVKLLKHAPVEHTEKRYLRELLLLALRMAALALLALAFARPFLASGAVLGSTPSTIVALDTSYSMSAPGRFERAQELARQAIVRAPGGSLVGVVTFADEAELVAKPSADRVATAAAIEQATVGFGATRYRAALATAARALEGRRGTIVVVTDLQASGWDAGDHVSVPDAARIEVVDVGALPPNLAVTAIRQSGDRVIATVRNAGARPWDTRVSLAVDNRPAGANTVSVPPNQTIDITFASVPRGSVLRATVDDREGLQADNVRYAVGGVAHPPVLLVTATGDGGREGFYLQQALAAGAAGDQPYDVVRTAAGDLTGWSDDRLRPNAAVILLSTRGLERRGRELLSTYVRSGGGILIAAGAEVDGEVVADVLGGEARLRVAGVDRTADSRALAPADVRHPLFRPFGDSAATLGLVRFQRINRIEGTGCEIVGRFTTGESALLDCAAGDGRAVVFASDLDNKGNDFPLHASFVPFVHEAVHYLASGRSQVGEYLVGEVPAGVPRVPGIATLPERDRSKPAAPSRIAVNVDPREADSTRISADEFQAAVTRLQGGWAAEARVEAGQQEERQHLWQYMVMMMIGVLAIEGLVASRTA
jgi:hypothetical protein